MLTEIKSRYSAIYDSTIGRLWIARFWDGLDRDLPQTRHPLAQADFLIAVSIALVGMIVSIWGFSQTNRVPEIHTMLDVFLHADVARMANNMVSIDGSHARTSVHPISSILLYPFGGILTAFGVDPLLAAKSLVIVAMGANAALFSLILRLLGLPRFAVALFALLFMATGSFLFWSVVVESFQFSCLSVLVSLFLMLRVQNSHWCWWVAANVLTLGFLITNWMFGLIATATRQKLKQFLAITISSLFLTIALSIVQNATFEKAALFFNPTALLNETQYIQINMEAEGTYEDGWQPVSNVRSIYATTVVAMPVEAQEFKREYIATTNQNTGLPNGELAPIAALAAWAILFGMGLWGASKRKDIRLVLIGVATMLFGQTILHVLYGEVTFLYSLNFMPLLVLIASLAYFTNYRHISVGLAICVIFFAGLNNERRLQETIDIAGCLAEIDSVRRIQTRTIESVSNGIRSEEIVTSDQAYQECNSKAR